MITPASQKIALLMPRPKSVIQDQLEDLRKVRALADEHGVHGFVDRIRMKNLIKEEEKLKEELLAAEMLESGNDIELSLDGQSVRDHMIRADFIGSFLKDLQVLMERLTFTAKYAKPLKAEVPDEVLSESELMFAGSKASSFTVLLKLVPPAQVPAAAPDLFAAQRRQSVLRDLRSLFNDLTPEKELTSLLAVSESRPVYRRLLQTVENHNAVIRFRTVVDPYEAKLTCEKAAERNKWMEEPEKAPKEEVSELTGELVGGSLERKGWFELRVGKVYYRGNISEDVRAQMRNIKFGARVQARIRHITEYRTKASSEPKTTDVLEHLIEKPEPRQETLVPDD